jgi:Holliday junction resolvasome RuvABC endonuclease subunit
MSLAILKKSSAHKVLGIDASTASLAFCLFENDKPVKFGKMPIVGADIYDKVKDAHRKSEAIASLVDPDYVAVESAIMVRSADAGLKIAMIVGASLAALLKPETKVITVAPIQWQSFIGNNNPTKADKANIRLEFPDKTDSWYKSKIRENRKQKTMDYFNNKFGINVTDNDTGDAIGISYYAYNKLTERS